MFIASNTKKYWPLQIQWHFNDDRLFLIFLNECFYSVLCDYYFQSIFLLYHNNLPFLPFQVTKGKL